MANYSRWDDVKKRRRAPDPDTRAGVEQDLALGQLIYDLRAEAGLSQRELAERMGTTQSVISRLEEGGGARKGGIERNGSGSHMREAPGQRYSTVRNCTEWDADYLAHDPKVVDSNSHPRHHLEGPEPTDRGGNVTSVVLVDGRVAGVWDLAEEPNPAIRVLLFEPNRPYRASIVDRAAEIAAFWFGGPVPVNEYASMVPLRHRSGVIGRPLDQAQPRSAARPTRRSEGPGAAPTAISAALHSPSRSRGGTP